MRTFSLSIQRGEIFAIAGGNGCGKTTLLREIIGLIIPSAGTIRLFGIDSRQLETGDGHPIHRRFGVMFQHGALFSSFTLAENVAVPLREHTTLSEMLIRDIVASKIAMVGLPPESAAKYPNELSGGMRRRAALARAIVMDPELLFLDEPTAGLDPIIAAGFDDLVLSLKSLLGLTVVMVTHDLDSLWRIANRVAVLGRGRCWASVRCRSCLDRTTLSFANTSKVPAGGRRANRRRGTRGTRMAGNEMVGGQ